MIKPAIVLAASAAFFSSAQAAEIPDELIEQCKSIGGCAVIVPDGNVIPLTVLQQQIQDALQEAYKAGRNDEAKRQGQCMKNSV